MTADELRRVEERVERGDEIGEDEARRLVEVVRGGGEAASGEGAGRAIEALVRANLGRALKTIDGAVRALPDGAEVDEAVLLDRAAEAIRRAARTYDPSRGAFGRWCGVLVWREVWREAMRAVRAAAPCLSLDAEGTEGERHGRETIGERVRDPRPTPDEAMGDAAGLEAPATSPASSPARRGVDDPPPALIPSGEAARRLGVKPKTLRRWVAAEKVPYVRFDRTIRFRPEDVDRVVRLRWAGGGALGARA